METTRVLGEILPISIPTACALERLLEEHPLKSFNHIYLNVATLFRNYHGAYPAEKLPPTKDFIRLFCEELDQIKSIIVESLPVKLQPVFYLTTCKSLALSFPHAKVRFPSTEKQKNYESLEIISLLDVLKKVKPGAIEVYDVAIKGNHTSALMLTHYPLDLLSFGSFRKLVLLESHTGNLKSKTEWVTKLSKNEEVRNIPFNLLTVQLLGDNNNRLHAGSRKMVQEFIALSKESRWNPTTTLEKCRFDIRKMADKKLSSELLEMSLAKLR